MRSAGVHVRIAFHHLPDESIQGSTKKTLIVGVNICIVDFLHCMIAHFDNLPFVFGESVFLTSPVLVIGKLGKIPEARSHAVLCVCLQVGDVSSEFAQALERRVFADASVAFPEIVEQLNVCDSESLVETWVVYDKLDILMFVNATV